jgi:hypothetical protein
LRTISLARGLVFCLLLASVCAVEPDVSRAQEGEAAPAAAPRLGAAQLDQLVAPIALYPDPLLAQVMMAST